MDRFEIDFPRVLMEEDVEVLPQTLLLVAAPQFIEVDGGGDIEFKGFN